MPTPTPSPVEDLLVIAGIALHQFERIDEELDPAVAVQIAATTARVIEILLERAGHGGLVRPRRPRPAVPASDFVVRCRACQRVWTALRLPMAGDRVAEILRDLRCTCAAGSLEQIDIVAAEVELWR